MILFDSSVVIDARDSDSPFHDWAKRQIAAAVQEGGEGGAVNAIVVSEASVRAEATVDAVPALLEGLALEARALAGFSGDSSRKSICGLFERYRLKQRRGRSLNSRCRCPTSHR